MNQILNLPISILRPLTLNWKFLEKLFWILSLSLIFAFLIFYIFQINQMTKLSFSISNCEKKIVAISNENKNLETNFSKYIGLENIETLVKNLNFEKPEKIHYLRILESTVAAKNEKLAP